MKKIVNSILERISKRILNRIFKRIFKRCKVYMRFLKSIRILIRILYMYVNTDCRSRQFHY